MTTDRPTGPATYTAEEAVRFAYAQGRDDERARIFAALPAALLQTQWWSHRRASGWTSGELAAALVAAIERVLGEER